MCRNAALLLQRSKFKAQEVQERIQRQPQKLVLFMYKKVKFIKVNLQTKNKSGMHALCTCVLKTSNISDAQPKEQKTTNHSPLSKKYFKSHHYFLPGDLHISETIKSTIYSVFSMIQYLDTHKLIKTQYYRAK